MNPSDKKDTRRLSHDLSWIWPIISPPEDYEEETGFDVEELKFEHSTFLEDDFLPMFVCLNLNNGDIFMNGCNIFSWIEVLCS